MSTTLKYTYVHTTHTAHIISLQSGFWNLERERFLREGLWVKSNKYSRHYHPRKAPILNTSTKARNTETVPASASTSPRYRPENQNHHIRIDANNLECERFLKKKTEEKKTRKKIRVEDHTDVYSYYYTYYVLYM